MARDSNSDVPSPGPHSVPTDCPPEAARPGWRPTNRCPGPAPASGGKGGLCASTIPGKGAPRGRPPNCHEAWVPRLSAPRGPLSTRVPLELSGRAVGWPPEPCATSPQAGCCLLLASLQPPRPGLSTRRSPFWVKVKVKRRTWGHNTCSEGKTRRKRGEGGSILRPAGSSVASGGKINHGSAPNAGPRCGV